MKNYLFVSSLFLLIFLCFTTLYAQNIQGIDGTTQEIRPADSSPGLGARAMGMGGAHIAVADDYTATYYNPANLAFITRMEVSGGLSNTSIKNSSSMNGYDASRNLSKTRFDYLGGVLVMPVVQGGASFALGYNRVNAFDKVLYISDTTKKALELSSGGLYALDIAGGIQIGKGLGLGATLEIYNGTENYSWDLEKYFGGYVQKVLFSDNIKYKYSGFGGKLGLTYSPNSILKFAGVIDFPGTLTIDEDGTSRTESLYTSASNYNEISRVIEQYSISMPFTFGMGASLNLMFLILAFDVDYTDWTQLEYKNPTWILTENKYIENTYRDVWRFRIGTEGIIPVVGVKLRMGYSYDPLPYKDSTIEDDRSYLTFGAGMLLARLISIDAAMTFSKYGRKNDTINLNENYDFTRLYLSLGFRF